MADIGQNRNWMVKPTADVEKKWIACQLQERKSQIVRLKQDIEDLKNGQIVKLEATIMMLEKEVEKLNNNLNSIDVTGTIVTE